MKIIKIFFILLLIVAPGCKLRDKKVDEKANYDKFSDSYKDNEYVNQKLNFKITFDDGWAVTNRYEQFNSFQKSYARYFSSAVGEVLFAGYHNDKKMGIRATCESLNLSNEEYLNSINSSLAEFTSKYQVKFLKNEDELLKSVKVRHVVISTQLNFNNKFVFDSIIFKLDKNNIKIDVWVDEGSYENEKDYILSIFNNIEIISVENQTNK